MAGEDFMVPSLVAFQLATTTLLTRKKVGDPLNSSLLGVTETRKMRENQKITWTRKIWDLLALHHKCSVQKMNLVTTKSEEDRQNQFLLLKDPFLVTKLTKSVNIYLNIPYFINSSYNREVQYYIFFKLHIQ